MYTASLSSFLDGQTPIYSIKGHLEVALKLAIKLIIATKGTDRAHDLYLSINQGNCKVGMTFNFKYKEGPIL